MVQKVDHPTLLFAYVCEGQGCERGPFRWRDQAEDCERGHNVLQPSRTHQQHQQGEIEQGK